MLAEILKEIEEAKKLATTTVDPEKDHATFHVKMGNIRRAKESLEGLFMEYKGALQPMLLLIVTMGNGGSKFAEICEKNNWGYQYDASDFYKDLVKEIDPLNYMNKAFSPNMCDIINRAIEDKADECDIVQFNMLLFKDEHAKVINSEEELVEHLIDMFNEQVGVEFMAVDILNKMAIRGVDDEFDGSSQIMPVIVKVGSRVNLVREMRERFCKITDNVFFVSAGVAVPKEMGELAFHKMQKIDKDSVIKTLKKIRSAIR